MCRPILLLLTICLAGVGGCPDAQPGTLDRRITVRVDRSAGLALYGDGARDVTGLTMEGYGQWITGILFRCGHQWQLIDFEDSKAGPLKPIPIAENQVIQAPYVFRIKVRGKNNAGGDLEHQLLLGPNDGQQSPAVAWFRTQSPTSLYVEKGWAYFSSELAGISVAVDWKPGETDIHAIGASGTRGFIQIDGTEHRVFIRDGTAGKKVSVSLKSPPAATPDVKTLVDDQYTHNKSGGGLADPAAPTVGTPAHDFIMFAEPIVQASRLRP